MTSNAPLSERELEILRLVAEGLTNQQIAYRLNIAANTVKVHLRNIFSKIGATSRTEATVYAIRSGLVQVGVAPADPAMPTGSGTPSDAEAPERSVDDLPDSTQAITPDSAPELHTPAATQPISSVAQPTPGLPRFVVPGLIVLLIVGVLVAAVIMSRPADVVQAPTALPAPTAVQVQPQRWSELTVLPSMRTDFGVAAYDRQMYVIGGSNASGPLGLVERYDPASNAWTTLDAKPTPATRIQAAMIGGVLYVPGGEGVQGQILSVLEAYDPRSKQWKTLSPLPQPISRYGLVAYEGRLYLFGGWDGTTFRDDVWVYDPGRDTWTAGARMPTARRDASAALLEDRVYVIGGEGPGGALSVVERYNPSIGESGAWESVAPLPEPIANPAAAGVVNMLFVFGANKTAVQYQALEDVWSILTIPTEQPLTQRVVPFGTTIIVFNTTADQPAQVFQYQAIYTTFLPGAISP